MSVQTLEQRRADLVRLAAAVQREIARADSAIADQERARLAAARRARVRRPRRSRKIVPPCGSESAYQRHRHLREDADSACLAAHSRHERERYAGNCPDPTVVWEVAS